MPFHKATLEAGNSNHIANTLGMKAADTPPRYDACFLSALKVSTMGRAIQF
jgi:hypothetical protein